MQESTDEEDDIFLRKKTRRIQTCKILSNNTPRKTKLRKDIVGLKSEIKLLKQKILCLEELNLELKLKIEVLEEEQNLNEEECEEKTFMKSLDKISPALSSYVENVFLNAYIPPHGRRYNNFLKTLALSVYFLSPLSYKHLKNDFNWPSIKTLQRFIKTWPSGPGLENSTLKALELRAKGLTEQQKIVVITIDEMSIKSHMSYDKEKDEIVGLDDDGDVRRPCVAKYVTVVMVQGIFGEHWSQPISYLFSHSGCCGRELKKHIIQIISLLQNINVIPVAICCDQGTNFQNFFKECNISDKNPFLTINGQNIVFFHDPPHLIKSARNCIQRENANVFFNGEKVNWSDICYLFNIEKKMSYKCSYKLTKQHLFPTVFKKMSVKLAAQVLSNTVGSSLLTLYQSGLVDKNKFPSLKNTAEFCLFFNKLFDFFNSLSSEAVTVSKKSFVGSENQIQFLSYARDIISSIKIIDFNGKDITKSYPFLKGWLLNINSILELREICLKMSINEIPTRRICQDELEHFFSSIRRGGGNCARITPRMFSALFKKRWGIKYLNVFVSGNCEAIPIEPQEIHVYQACREELIQNLTWQSEFVNIELFKDCDSINIDPEQNFLFQNSHSYFCGWLYTKLLSQHECLSEIIYVNSQNSGIGNMFALEKQNNDIELMSAPINFINYISKLDIVFKENFNDNCHKKGIASLIIEEIKKLDFYKCCVNCPHNFIISLFVRVRIYLALREFNSLLCDVNSKPKFLSVSNL